VSVTRRRKRCSKSRSFESRSASFFRRALGAEIEDADFALLPHAMQRPDALFDLHWVPGQVVVYQERAELKILTFAANLGREQYRGAHPKLIERRLFMSCVETAVKTHVVDVRPPELFRNFVQCAPLARENQRLLAVAGDDLDQSSSLATGAKRTLKSSSASASRAKPFAMFIAEGHVLQRAE
jgi:hypothetical protein